MVEEQTEKKCCEKSGIKYVSAYHNICNLGKRGFDDRKLGVKMCCRREEKNAAGGKYRFTRLEARGLVPRNK